VDRLAARPGRRRQLAGELYRAGLALLDLDNPAQVIKRCDEWVLGPSEDYEISGDVPGVVFPCGLIHDTDQGRLRMYYGAADCRIGMASARFDEVMAFIDDHG